MERFAWKIVNEAGETRIDIFDEIGSYGITAKDFIKDLQGIKSKKLLVVIDSGGGSLIDAFTIYSALGDFAGTVTTHARMAMSAASLILMAGSKREISPRGQILIHLPRASDITGTTDEVAAFSKSMTSLTMALAGTYQAATGKGSQEFWLDAMRKETIYTADEAVEAGLVHKIVDRKAEEAIAAKSLLVAIRAGLFQHQLEREVRRGIVGGIAAGMVSAFGPPPPPRPHKWDRAGGGTFAR